MKSIKIARNGFTRPNPVLILTGLLLLAGILPQTCPPASAQSVQGAPVDLKFEVINATTGEPCGVERMTIEYMRTRRNGILDFEPRGSSFVAPGVPIKDVGQYIVTVWYQNVPYWWSLRGNQLMGQTTKLHVFDTTNKLDGVSIVGLNLVVRRQESLLKLEYMLQVENKATPQHTIIDGVATFELNFPADASQIEATYRRGPDPTPIPASTHGSKRLSLVVPLTPGLNHLRIEATMPWQENMEIPVGSTLEIVAWSLLSSPQWLEVDAMGLQETTDGEIPGFNRWIGPTLEAKRELSLLLTSGEYGAGEAEDLFTQASPAANDAQREAAQEEKKSSGFPLPFVFGGVFTIILVVGVIRKRQ